jgi:hypothetical protein
MAFDQTTRNRLARFVSDTRALLTEEFTRQLQHEYGLDPASGEITPIDRLTALDDTRRETAHILRETLDYYLAGNSKVDGKIYREVLDRIVREQAFTVLNRLCALRMSEARGLVLESIAKGYQSKGFQLYARLAGSALGETGQAYRLYLFSLMDEFAVDLPVLFDRFSPQGRLFPREAALLKLLALINEPEIDLLWTEDETIGWIYQYFNSREERKTMRDASQAPRNSRELAVRNQFFTPRYVVEFLTDNTLGRIWYEMTKGETALKDTCRYLVRRPNEIFLDQGEAAPEQTETSENLSQEELLRQPIYFPHRPLKDPREIKMFDPACGSMHFGLYAFDLFEQIYAEAWDLEERLGEDALQRLADLDSLHKTYPNKETFLRDVPRLIIERNIHGVDIDPRAVQISGLSLWLRAQKSWQAQGLRPAERPQIHMSNVVCAEPMPGDRQMLEEFLSTLHGDGLEALMRTAWHVPVGQKVRATPQMADALAKLVRIVWQEMELAGEAGSLLKIEETLRDAISIARKESEEKSPLFRVLEYGLGEASKEQYVQLLAGKDQDFFDRAEGLVLAALKDYAEQAVNGEGFRRHLFAGDATKGFAFIAISRILYDIVVMNPPFGELSELAQEYLTNRYPLSSNNIATIFVERMTNKLNPLGGLALIIDNSTSIRSSYEDFRKTILYNSVQLYTYASLGWEVLDANVEVCAYSCFKISNKIGNCFCLDVSKIETKENFLEENILSISQGVNAQFVIVNPEEFKVLPNAIPNFSIPQGIRSLFSKFPSVNTFAQFKTGMSSGDNERFYKMFWEKPQLFENDWKFLSNGGEYSPYYRGDREIINWHRDGIEIREHKKATFRNTQFYSRIGLSYSKRCEYLSVQLLPSGFAFTDEGQCIFPLSEENRSGLLAFFNSKFARVILNEYCGQHKSNGYLQLIPFPNINLSILGRIADDIAKILHDELLWTLPSIYSCGPLLLNPAIFDQNKSINEIRSNLEKKWRLSKTKIDDYEESINKMINECSGINESEVNYINLKAKKIPAAHFQLSEQKTNGYSLVSEFLDYVMGVLFGYWNIKNLKKTIEVPLDNAPIFPPGTLYEDKPLAPNNIPDSYPININWLGIVESQTPTVKADLQNKLEDILRIIWKEKFENVELEIVKSIKTSSIEEYFRNPDLFFKDHIKRYSKGRRVAPIYWPLSTPSSSYTLWLYYHRLSDQTLYTCVNDFVDPKLKQVSEGLSRLRLKKGRSAADEKELERLTDFERELRDFREELLRVAKFWKPNLNDGVEITAAPLWKLFQHKPWQKRLKETWQKLEAGEYDWAHLAYSIWPERVREKCKSDKSLAIAHDLEELFVESKKPLNKKESKKKATNNETEGWFDED